MRRTPSPAGDFDLHDVGTEVGEVAGRARAREHRRHVDDPQSLERLHRPQATSLRREDPADRYEIVNSLTMPSSACGLVALRRVGEEADQHVVARRQAMVWYMRLVRAETHDAAGPT